MFKLKKQDSTKSENDKNEKAKETPGTPNAGEADEKDTTIQQQTELIELLHLQIKEHEVKLSKKRKQISDLQLNQSSFSIEFTIHSLYQLKKAIDMIKSNNSSQAITALIVLSYHQIV